MEDGKLVAGAEGMGGNMSGMLGVGGSAGSPGAPKKPAPGGAVGMKRDNSGKSLSGQGGVGMPLEAGKEGAAVRMGLGGVSTDAWAVEKAQLVQENLHLRNAASLAAAEAEERRRAAAELEKAKAEIER